MSFSLHKRFCGKFNTFFLIGEGLNSSLIIFLNKKIIKKKIDGVFLRIFLPAIFKELSCWLFKNNNF